MAGRSGLQPFSLPGDFNEKVIILLIFVDALCKSCHGSRPAHLSWLGRRGAGTGKAAAIACQGQAGTRLHPGTYRGAGIPAAGARPSHPGRDRCLCSPVSPLSCWDAFCHFPSCFSPVCHFPSCFSPLRHEPHIFSVSFPRQDSGYPERAEVSRPIKIRE